MDELIKITEYSGNNAVSARELYEFLGFDLKNWSRWYKKNIEDNEFAIENIDYQPLVIKKNGSEGNFAKDFALSIDFAKKLSMLARTEKGEKARNYFIQCEKELKQGGFALPQTFAEALKLAANQAEENERLRIENENKQKHIDKLIPRSNFVDIVFSADDLLTGSQVCKILKLGYGNITLYKKLREMRIFYKNKNEPMQKIVDSGYIKMKEVLINEKIKLQPLFTQKGLGYIAKLFNKLDNKLQLAKIN